MERINVTQAVRQFSDLLNRVCYQGQSFELERGNKVIAQLSPVPRKTPGVAIKDLNQLFSELPSLKDDIDNFAEDLTAIRRVLTTERDPWASC